MTRTLGRTDIPISPVGLGCWQFSGGDGLVGGFWGALDQSAANEIVRISLELGVTWFDTAEIYGRGRSEETLAASLRAAGRGPGDVVVATKWWPMWRTAASIGTTINERLARLGGFPIDLYQIHQPFAFATVAQQMDAMAALAKGGRVRAVGVSNFGAARMRNAHAALAKHGLPLASNQMPYSLLDRRIESSGVMAAAKELGVTIIAYSPLAQGLLSGKFHDDPSLIRQRSGPRKWMGAFREKGLTKSRPVVEAVRAIATDRGVTPSQVALRWLTQFHGDTVVVIPGATSPRQAAENAGAMRFELTRTELERLDTVSRAFL